MTRKMILIGLLGLVSFPLPVWSQQAPTSKSSCKHYFGVLWQDEKIAGGFMIALIGQSGRTATSLASCRAASGFPDNSAKV